MYIIIIEGAFRHEILGLYQDKEKALSEAKEQMLLELDNYHTYNIYECPVNTIVEDATEVFILTRHGEGGLLYIGVKVCETGDTAVT